MLDVPGVVVAEVAQMMLKLDEQMVEAVVEVLKELKTLTRGFGFVVQEVGARVCVWM